ncbi:hypothetical protein LWI29_027971 [Acer saccharum]|uniref:Zinc knuckle CX2CX4HX4C domain-containing protein n=1 Tax=Acer saccharum TaxID=4024 RepID=A0AA39SF53_ACESA|nr:hypothetical protein LWI29_027971 [Acer saccharum]
MDKATIDGDFGHFAKVLMDVDMSVLLPSSVILERGELHSSFILIKYEYLPSFCSVCSSIGHLPSSCRRNNPKVPVASAEKSPQPMAGGSVEEPIFQLVHPRSSKMVYPPVDKPV